MEDADTYLYGFETSLNLRFLLFRIEFCMVVSPYQISIFPSGLPDASDSGYTLRFGVRAQRQIRLNMMHVLMINKGSSVADSRNGLPEPLNVLTANSYSDNSDLIDLT